MSLLTIVGLVYVSCLAACILFGMIRGFREPSKVAPPPADQSDRKPLSHIKHDGSWGSMRELEKEILDDARAAYANAYITIRRKH